MIKDATFLLQAKSYSKIFSAFIIDVKEEVFLLPGQVRRIPGGNMK